MINSTQFTAYLDLLKVKQKYRRQAAIFLGAILIILILVTWATGMVTGLAGREIYLIGLVDIGLGISFIMAWVRLEIVNANIELLNSLFRK